MLAASRASASLCFVPARAPLVESRRIGHDRALIMSQAGLKLPARIPDKGALARIGAQVRQRLSDNPDAYRIDTDKAEIFAVGDFMSAEECDRMVAMIDAVAKPSKAFDAKYQQAYRTSYSGDVDPWDPFVLKIQRRIDDLIGLPTDHGETVQGQRYLPGQEFRQHFDWFHPSSGYWKTESTRGGQRSYTTMVFLNDVEGGGTTDFPALGLSITPRRGVLLAWNNADREGVPSEWVLHAGRPVTAGVKYIITKWYRTRKWG